MNYIYIILLFFASYLLGSIQSGLIIGKVFKKIDIREHGSKSTGSTNAIRVLGFKYGIWAFFFDTLKGAILILILKWIAYEPLYMLNDTLSFVSIYGLFAVLGHVFSIFNHFKGGKAVATSLGAIIAVEPLIAVIVLATFAIVFFAKRYVSLASSFAALSALISFIVRIFLPLHYTNVETKIFDLFIFIMLGVMIALRHRTNYQRLKEGTENKM
jgi:glycerol-3-phosphate acyltransferase PlsY